MMDIKLISLCIGKGGKVAYLIHDHTLQVWINEMVEFAPSDAIVCELEDFLANWGLFVGSDEDRKQYFPGWENGYRRFVVREPEIN